MTADWLLAGAVPLLFGAVFRGADGLLGGVPLGLDEPLVADPPFLCLAMVLLGGAALLADGVALWCRMWRSVGMEKP